VACLRLALKATTVISGCPTTSSPSIASTPAMNCCADFIIVSAEAGSGKC
jgi:hypothetical protein